MSIQLDIRKRQKHHDNVLYTTTMSIFESQIHLKSDMVVKTLPNHNFGVLWQNWDSYYKLKAGNDYHESEIVIGAHFMSFYVTLVAFKS